MSAGGVIAVMVVGTICLLVLATAALVVIALARAAREDASTVFHGAGDES